MSRIFISLSLLPVVLIFTTMGVGWWIGDYNVLVLAARSDAARAAASDRETAGDTDASPVPKQELKQSQSRFRLHFQLGLATALSVVLINSLSVTYLIGTSRWVKEVRDAYELDHEFVRQSNQLKRQTFPWSVGGVLMILAVIALGAASDPGTLRENTASWVQTHAVTALLGASLIIWALIMQAFNLQRNAEVIQQVVESVRREREARGLPVEG